MRTAYCVLREIGEWFHVARSTLYAL